MTTDSTIQSFIHFQPVVSREHLRLNHAARPIRKHGTLQLHYLYLTVYQCVLASMMKPSVVISTQSYPAPVMKADVQRLVRASFQEISLNCRIAVVSNQHYQKRIHRDFISLPEQSLHIDDYFWLHALNVSIWNGELKPYLGSQQHSLKENDYNQARPRALTDQ